MRIKCVRFFNTNEIKLIPDCELMAYDGNIPPVILGSFEIHPPQEIIKKETRGFLPHEGRFTSVIGCQDLIPPHAKNIIVAYELGCACESCQSFQKTTKGV